MMSEEENIIDEGNPNIDDNRDELDSEVIDYTDLEMTDEHGTEWVEVNYSYECPIDNYMDGEETETIETVYKGPKFLYLWVETDTHLIRHVQREFEVLESTDNWQYMPSTEEMVIVKLDAREYPLDAEVMSDYHDNYKDKDEWEETPGTKSVPVPEGYVPFEYEYPIHPDDLYDEKLSVWNFETNELDLYKHTNEDIIGAANTWEDLRIERDERLSNTDTLFLILKDIDKAKWDKLVVYRQLLRDFPAAMQEANVPIIFVDSSWPRTDVLE
jgi:hypothetical protein